VERLDKPMVAESEPRQGGITGELGDSKAVG
jgi:hypothetical protein